MKRILLVYLLLTPLLTAAVRPQDNQQELHRKASQLHHDKEYQKAIEVYAEILNAHPADSTALYNTACAHALLGNRKEAVDFLGKAVQAGFVDFAHIESDTDLYPIRKEEGYKKIFAKRAEIEKASMDRRIAEMQEKLGDSYRSRRDEERKIVIVSDLPDNAIDGYFETLRRYQNALHSTFFEHLPDYWILVLIPANADDYTKKLGGSSGAAGFYESGTQTLTVNIATGGGTIVHEWTHAMNFADMAALRQSHPLWMLEGFGSLYEQVGISDGRPVGYTNWRLPQIQNMIQNNSVIPMRDFIMNSKKHFDRDATSAYAQTRYIFYYLQEKNLLQKFYRTYIDGYAEDATGIVAMEKVLGQNVENWFGEWKDFTLDLTFGNICSRPRIGVQLEAADGRLKIVKVVEGSGADRAGLNDDDVIIEVEGQQIPSLDYLQKFLEGKKRGDHITLKVTRGGQEKETRVTLQ